MKRYTYTLFLLCLLLSFKCYAQKDRVVKIDWSDPVSRNIDGVQYEALNFKGAYFDANQPAIPVYKSKIKLPENISQVSISVEVLKKSLLTPIEKNYLPQHSATNLSWEVSYERKVPYLKLSYVPIEGDFKIDNFKYSIELTYKEFDLRNKPIVQSSVLSEGDWYKLKVSEDGLYKIDKSFIEDLGLNVAEIDPRKIQIYGNGGGMLPEHNAEFRYDDLVQNSIYVSGEDDGSFDSNDFVVFYAEAPHRWELDSISQKFVHVLNIYDDNNYCYFHVGSEFGKRVENDNQSLESNFEVDHYTDYKFYEWENQNLQHTGRQWFGEYFSYNENYNINFNILNRIKTEPIYIQARGVARSSTSTSLVFKNNASTVLEVPLGVQINSGAYVDDGISNAEFISQDNVIGVNVSYENNGNSSAFAYLDYIELQAKCALQYGGGQLLVREPTSVAENRITKFNLNSTSNTTVVWDVTNPTNAKQLLFSSTDGFVSETSKLKTFAIHDLKSSSYKNPVYQGQLANQNLHGHTPADLIIITAPEFLDAANRLAEFHRNADGITVNVVTTYQIYNEFSSGKQDLIALRSYLRMLYAKAETEDEIIDDVLLFGDASFDYKNIGEANNRYVNQNFVPTFESEYSFKLGPSYCTDDFLGFLDEDEGAIETISSDGLDVGIGRIVVQTSAEAEAVVDKIINYSSVNSFGDWRTNICFVADDVDDDSWEFRLQENMDKIAQFVDTNYHNYNVNKIYLDAYQQVSSSGGQRYPEARQAIIDNVNSGTLIMHYYGHGGEVGWAEERVLELVDINAWENINNLPVFITATCEFSRYDDAKRVSAGEQILLNPEGAGIALFTTTRTITESDAKNLSTSFYKYAIPESAGEVLSFGQIMRCMKNDLNSSGISMGNKLKFSLLGDPALRMPIPQLEVVVTEVVNSTTNLPTDTIQALSKVKISGEVLNHDGELASSFNGFLKPKVFDKPSSIQTLNNDFDYLESFQFKLQQSVLYAGNVTVENGLFEFEFVVPKDIAYANGFGKFSLYAYNESEDAIGSYVDIVIGGFDENAEVDNLGPEVELFMNTSEFKYGGITDANPSLYAIVSDDSGINTTGNGIGHDIVATLDDDSQSAIVLNHYYEADLDSYQSGVVRYPFSNLEEGVHHLKIKLWDVHNNSAEDVTEFLVVNNEGLILDNLLNYPNPFSDFTQIHFEHNRPGEELEVRVDIYDMNGRRVKSMEEVISSASYANASFTWNGDSDNGASLGSGMYLCKVFVLAKESKEESVISSQMILIK
jgi:hypothetical protein